MHPLQVFVENPSRLHQRSAPLADLHLNLFEPLSADDWILNDTFKDIDHVIKDVEHKWRGDIFWLQAQIASWCPAWEPKAEQLLTDVDAQKTRNGKCQFRQVGSCC